MRKKKTKKEVVMVRRVAARWVSHMAMPEYRFRVLLGGREIRNLPNLLRSFRDAKIAMAGIPPIRDLGIQENGDHLEVWSRQREHLLALSNWFEKRGYETTGIW